MEDTLGDMNKLQEAHNVSLNPCFNGRYSRSVDTIVEVDENNES